MNNFYTLKRKISSFPDEVRFFIQRGRKGYSDRDVWGIDQWAMEVLPAMIRKLSRDVTSYPQDCKDLLQWKRELNKMAKNIESFYKFEMSYEPLSDDEELPSLIDKDTVSLYIARRKRAENKTKKGLHQFTNRFFDLWD